MATQESKPLVPVTEDGRPLTATNIFDHIFEKLIPKGLTIEKLEAQMASGMQSATGYDDDEDQIEDLTVGAEGVRRVGDGSGVTLQPQPEVIFELDYTNEATKEAMQFIEAEAALKRQQEEAELEAAKAQAAEGDADDDKSKGEKTKDPYYGTIDYDDPEKIYVGKCRLFHQQKGFGFIEPTPGVRPPGMPGNATLPDIYFQKEDIVVHGQARSVLESLGQLATAGQKQKATALHALSVGEDVEFKVVNATHANSDKCKLRAVEITGLNRGPVAAHVTSGRQRGLIRHWNANDEYGFIAPNSGGKDVFFHASMLFWGVPANKRQVELGFVVEYTPVRQPGRGRDAAEGRQVALCVTDVKFAPINPATIPKSASASIQKERDRKRKREEDDEQQQRAQEDARLEAQYALATDDDTYATW